MIDSVTLNQLRAFVAVCNEQSFSKASRRLSRAQSAISHAISALETALGVALFVRSGSKPKLTAAGRSLLADAQAIISRTEELKTRARSIVDFGDAELSLAVDAFFPRAPLIRGLIDLQWQAPMLRVRLFTETMQGGEALVLDGRCGLALVAADTPELNGDRIERRYLCETRFVAVCAPSHPLAAIGQPISAAEFARHIQLVLSDHSEQTEGFRKGIAGERNWLLADLAAKHDFLLAGLGWGNMPEELVSEDIANGRLVKLASIAWGDRSASLVFAISMLRGRQQQPSEAWLIKQLSQQGFGLTVLSPAAKTASKCEAGSKHRQSSPKRPPATRV